MQQHNQLLTYFCTGSMHVFFPGLPILPVSSDWSFYLCTVMCSVEMEILAFIFSGFFLLQIVAVVLLIGMIYVSCVIVGEIVGNFLTTVSKSGGATEFT